MPICDLDKRRPHAKKVIGLDVVVWWDRNGETWKVFDDRCPHRLAPLSEGRIDQWGRLQCVYHGWCFNGSGNCMFIPQANPDGPPVHTAKKGVAVYPSTVQNNIVWFWPNLDPRYKDILVEKKPPYIPEIDDPSYTNLMGNRDIPYGYWSHVVNCASCSAAYKGFNVLEVFLRVVSVASIAIAAAAKQGAISAAARTTMVLMAVLFYASSRWLAHFIYRNFHYHDYDHAFR
nr:isoform 2 of protochlorophyllide-dependent translocon component 52, chloroplastic [Quercus suber]